MPTGKRVRGLWAVGAVLAVGAGTASVFLLNGGGDPRGTAAIATTKVQRAAPAPDDPLTEEEIRAATDAVLGVTVRSTPGQQAPELLYVERDDDKQAEDQRRANAYTYDYSQDKLTITTVDLKTSTVIGKETAEGVQPPPSDNEERRAAELILADPTLGNGVRSTYEGLAGKPLKSADDLHLRGVIFSPDHVNEPDNATAVADCGKHRCVRLFIRMPKGKWLDTSRIVIDLSAKKIYTLRW
jgi:hypothetical protein